MRLAERTGLLTGRSLSPVATFGVEILMMLDARDRNEDWLLDFKAQMAAAHPQLMNDLFPPDPFASARLADGDYDPDKIDQIDPADLEWSVPETATEREDLDRWIQEHMSGTVSADALGDSEGGDWQ